MLISEMRFDLILFFQLVAFLFAPIILPIYFLLLPFIACVLSCRRRCRKSTPTPTVAELCQTFWQPSPSAAPGISQLPPSFFTNLSEIIEGHLDHQLADYFHRLSLLDRGTSEGTATAVGERSERMKTFSYVNLKSNDQPNEKDNFN